VKSFPLVYEASTKFVTIICIKSVTHNTSFCQFIHGEPKHVAVNKLIKTGVVCENELLHTLLIRI